MDKNGQVSGQRGILLACELLAQLVQLLGLGGFDESRGLRHIQQSRGIECAALTHTVKRTAGETINDSILACSDTWLVSRCDIIKAILWEYVHSILISKEYG